MLILTLIFALVHSGLASFRDTGEKLIGERGFRVFFAGVSLPLAVSTVVSTQLNKMVQVCVHSEQVCSCLYLEWLTFSN